MAQTTYLTIGELAKLFGIAQWQARRAVDGLKAEIPRAGLYRLVPRSLLPVLTAELDRRGWLSDESRFSDD